MNFVTTVKTCLLKSSIFYGRAPWSEYWWFMFLDFGFAVLQSLIQECNISVGLIGILLMMGTFAVSVRHFHDLDYSGW